MELWQDSEIGSPRISCSRIWKGSAPDVAEVNLDDASSQMEAISLIGMIPWILVRCSDWTMIPLENLIADASGTGTRICAEINRIEDIQGAIFALEIGVDALLLPCDEDMWSKAQLLRSNRDERLVQNSNLEMIEVTIDSIEDGGIGERVCIDLIERMKPDEGLCIGSFSSCMVLVQAEVNENPHVPTRPFRVNAGAIHAYVLSDDKNTQYLEELHSGMSVSIISVNGQLRSCSVGRVKIEHRPFLMIRFSSDNGINGQILLQQAETVRLLTSSGTSIDVTSLKVGEKVLAMTLGSARHMGKGVPSMAKEV